MCQLLSWAFTRSPGDRGFALARLASFCDSGLFFPLWGRVRQSPWPGDVGSGAPLVDHRDVREAG
jgi:hypothetical protein